MPSPFPGMDPYLENPIRWPSFHNALALGIQSELNRTLRPKYYARVEERIYLSDQDESGRSPIIPDVRVIERPTRRYYQDLPAGSLTITEPVVMTTLLEDEVHELYVELRSSTDHHVVTVIEVLSPSNKASGSRGWESYRNKRTEVMVSQTHWVEIDLLREGTRFVTAEPRLHGDYFVHSSKVELRPNGLVWPIRLPERLPVIGIPLMSGDADSPLDLQPLVEAIYDNGAYDADIDYYRDPIPPLPAHYTAWADELLKAKGLRS